MTRKPLLERPKVSRLKLAEWASLPSQPLELEDLDQFSLEKIDGGADLLEELKRRKMKRDLSLGTPGVSQSHNALTKHASSTISVKQLQKVLSHQEIEQEEVSD